MRPGETHGLLPAKAAVEVEGGNVPAGRRRRGKRERGATWRPVPSSRDCIHRVFCQACSRLGPESGGIPPGSPRQSVLPSLSTQKHLPYSYLEKWRLYVLQKELHAEATGFLKLCDYF
jgi:hypothetical protein